MSGIKLTKKDKSYVDISLAFTPSPVTGDLSVITNESAINQSIRNIIMTAPNEVVFNRNFGSTVSTYLFDFIDQGTAGLINIEIRRAINFNEPRAKLIDVVVDAQPDQHQFVCRVSYEITGSERTFEVDYILKPTR